jgi:putative transposase
MESTGHLAWSASDSGAAQTSRSGEKPGLTAAILDSQTVKTADHGGPRGYDAGKKITGRKRHISVDTLGSILSLVLHAADIQDRDGGKLVLQIWADGGYAGALVDWVKALPRRRRSTLEIVKRSDQAKGFKVLPHRWIVERTLGWLGKFRSLSKDYEISIDSATAFIYIAQTRHLLAFLSKH